MDKKEIVLSVAGDLAVKLMGAQNDNVLLSLPTTRDKALDQFGQAFKRVCRIVAEAYDEIA